MEATKYFSLENFQFQHEQLFNNKEQQIIFNQIRFFRITEKFSSWVFSYSDESPFIYYNGPNDNYLFLLNPCYFKSNWNYQDVQRTIADLTLENFDRDKFQNNVVSILDANLHGVRSIDQIKIKEAFSQVQNLVSKISNELSQVCIELTRTSKNSIFSFAFQTAFKLIFVNYEDEVFRPIDD